MAQYAVEKPEAVAPAIANPAPLGLFGFALTTFVLSASNAGLFGVTAAKGLPMVLGLAFFYGGLAQLFAGMWEFRRGNTFGAAAFSSYGAFWLSFAFTAQNNLIPSTTALAWWLLAWGFFSFLMLLVSLRINIALILLFVILTLTYVALAIGYFASANGTWIQIGGILGIATALVAWYTALAGVLDSGEFAFKLPVGTMG
ncbi:MAG: acetate uptake transporter [Ktedonobacteraceae bacterium]